ncbi:MAG: hypothetical protein A2008_13160 [Candidatus Wallbacteria bacterium GWC2_49_35]|uniref:Uncharacterized protein n=1 Tax=Candidatus Wallbacteria bacterium GWC2_49_35 TaxID=1817813 RepID=A0A1F7WLE9_9BACT|nr:MAG: hypothetical protein A2008_13160 [Candidatus Wallbacteria bacterium GWC2_49_35]HBC74383.1 hypothetical protein [Candidatus Wallbacteria bacterium]
MNHIIKTIIKAFALAIIILSAAVICAPPPNRIYAFECAATSNKAPRNFEEFYDALCENRAVGIPLYLKCASSEVLKRTIPEGYFLMKAFDSGTGLAVEFSAAAGTEAFPEEKLKNAAEETLEIYFYRSGGGRLKKSGTALVIPRALKLHDGGGYRVYFVLKVTQNPYNDRGKIYAYIKKTDRSDFGRRIAGLFKILEGLGLEVTPEFGGPSGGSVDGRGRPQGFIAGYAAQLHSDRAAFYPSTFVMPRKTGFKDGAGEAARLLSEIIAQGYLLSSRSRLYSASGAPVKKWNYECGNDDRVFLSYGPGITYSDPESCMFVLSPEVMFLGDVEFTDRDTFYFKPRVIGRDPLSEAWHSSFNENPREVNENIKSSVIEFNRAGGLETPEGRAGYIKNLDRFWLEEGLFYTSPLASALYDKFNNEVKAPDLVFLDKFAECLIADAAVCENVVAALKKDHGIDHFAGVPAGDFVFPAYCVREHRPDGDKTDLHIRYAYLEYILREARRPEFLALALARKEKDLYSYIRILQEASAVLEKITSSPEYAVSKKLRRTLRKIPLSSSLYAVYLEKYRWWLDPSEEKTLAAYEAGPIGEARLQNITREIAAALEKISGHAEKISVRARYAKKEDYAKYIIYKDGELIIDFAFLSMVRYRCGTDGVYHLLAQELAADFRPGDDPFALAERSLAALGRKPAYEELCNALQVSKERRRAVKERAVKALR